DHRTLHVDKAWVGYAATIFAGGHRRVLEIAPEELGVHRVELLAEEDPVDEPREPRRTAEVFGIGGEHDLLAPRPALEPERPGADGLGAERLAELLDGGLRAELGLGRGPAG